MSSNLKAVSSSSHSSPIVDDNLTTARISSEEFFPRTRRELYNSQHQPVRRGHKIGTGGEGTVYEINGHPDLAAKLYHAPPSPEKIEKLLALADLGTERLFQLSAWPVDVLRDEPGGQVIGFVMKKIREAEEVHALHSPKSRLQKFPDASWSFLLYAAANIARAVAVMHEHSFVIGDLNPKNILVTRKATIHLLDCDSFQLNVAGRTLRCDAGFPEYTPPELQGVPFKETDRTQHHDCFGLAVVIFQLLFLGRHPFSGRFLGAGEMSLERAIGESRFAFGDDATTRQMQPPPGALSLSAIPDEITSLFRRAFLSANRPTASDWIAPLETLANSLKKCAEHSGHHFYQELADCPWCELEARTNARLFNFALTGNTAQRGHFRLDEIWKQIETIAPPAALLIEQPPLLPLLPASPSAVAVGRNKRKRFFLALFFSAIAGFGTGWFAGFCFGVCLLLLAGIIAREILGNSATASSLNPANNKVLSLSLSSPGLNSLQPFEDAKTSAQNAVWQLEQRWQKEGGIVRFEEKLDALRAQRESYENLAQIRTQKLRQIEADARTAQLDDFLEQFSITETPPQNLSDEIKASLLSAGIETAADITPPNLRHKVSRLETRSEAVLLRWREQLEKSFVFDAARSISQPTRLQVEKEIDELRQRLELEISNGAEHLRRLCREAESRRQKYLAGLTEARQTLLQAESDLLAATQPVSMIPVIAMLIMTFIWGGIFSSNRETRLELEQPAPVLSDAQRPYQIPGPTIDQNSPTQEDINQSQKLNEQGESRLKLKKFKEAISLFRKAIEVNPNHLQAHENLGYALYRVNQFEESVNVLLAAVNLGGDFDSFYYLGQIYVAQKKWPEAEDALLRVIGYLRYHHQRGDRFPQAYDQLGLTLKQLGKLNQTIQSLEENLLKDPDLIIERFELGNLYLWANKPWAAQAQYRVLNNQDKELAEYLRKLMRKHGVSPSSSVRVTIKE